MKFPGKRNRKHYFPISERGRIPFATYPDNPKRVYVAGIDQLLVDIEVNVDDDYLAKYDLEKGQSFVLNDDIADEIYHELKSSGRVVGEYAGGSVGNTLHNYSVLADDKSVAFGGDF